MASQFWGKPPSFVLVYGYYGRLVLMAARGVRSAEERHTEGARLSGGSGGCWVAKATPGHSCLGPQIWRHLLVPHGADTRANP